MYFTFFFRWRPIGPNYVFWCLKKTAVYDSINLVIEAVTKCKMLEIKCPTSHENQKRIAKGFQEKSKAGFSKCVGAIDGMLLWITKPSEKECSKVGVGSKQFFCGRKKKYGLNLQACCDHQKRSTNVSII